MKQLHTLLLTAFLLAGCASQPVKTIQPINSDLSHIHSITIIADASVMIKDSQKEPTLVIPFNQLIAKTTLHQAQQLLEQYGYTPNHSAITIAGRLHHRSYPVIEKCHQYGLDNSQLSYQQTPLALLSPDQSAIQGSLVTIEKLFDQALSQNQVESISTLKIDSDAILLISTTGMISDNNKMRIFDAIDLESGKLSPSSAAPDRYTYSGLSSPAMRFGHNATLVDLNTGKVLWRSGEGKPLHHINQAIKASYDTLIRLANH